MSDRACGAPVLGKCSEPGRCGRLDIVVNQVPLHIGKGRIMSHQRYHFTTQAFCPICDALAAKRTVAHVSTPPWSPSSEPWTLERDWRGELEANR